MCAITATAHCIGSSPLARGLLCDAVSPVWVVGIIPARAGFTSVSPVFSGSRRDHPRSRGVYAFLNGIAAPSPGSSPLARGLHVGDRPADAHHRIIPARAGFTTIWRTIWTWKAGSSPLARGLRRSTIRSAWVRRIIPARAGFTPRSRICRTVVRDHPRSRGVYYTYLPMLSHAHGSSPLARGLPDMVIRSSYEHGIIPARAGFTRGPGPDAQGGRDHPRSRGVYSPDARLIAESAGSSPLARGLRAP